MRLPSSPLQGTRSSPGKSFPNFTQWTVRAAGAGGAVEEGVGPQGSLGIRKSPGGFLFSPYCKFGKIPSEVAAFGNENRGQRFSPERVGIGAGTRYATRLRFIAT